MFEKGKFRSKFRVEVDVTLMDGSRMRGDLFLGHEQRVLDLLNDDRAFVPLEIVNGGVNMLSKTAIMQITPTQQNLSSAEPIPLKVVDRSNDMAKAS